MKRRFDEKALHRPSINENIHWSVHPSICVSIKLKHPSSMCPSYAYLLSWPSISLSIHPSICHY